MDILFSDHHLLALPFSIVITPLSYIRYPHMQLYSSFTDLLRVCHILSTLIYKWDQFSVLC